MKKNKLFFIFVIVAIIIISLMTVSYGFGVNDIKGTRTGADNDLNKVGNDIIKIITTVGSILSVIVLVIMGIKYMMGSVEEKAEYKKTMMPYVIGFVILFAASTIASVIYNVAINL